MERGDNSGHRPAREESIFSCEGAIFPGALGKLPRKQNDSKAILHNLGGGYITGEDSE